MDPLLDELSEDGPRFRGVSRGWAIPTDSFTGMDPLATLPGGREASGSLAASSPGAREGAPTLNSIVPGDFRRPDRTFQAGSRSGGLDSGNGFQHRNDPAAATIIRSPSRRHPEARHRPAGLDRAGRLGLVEEVVDVAVLAGDRPEAQRPGVGEQELQRARRGRVAIEDRKSVV